MLQGLLAAPSSLCCLNCANSRPKARARHSPLPLLRNNVAGFNIFGKAIDLKTQRAKLPEISQIKAGNRGKLTFSWVTLSPS